MDRDGTVACGKFFWGEGIEGVNNCEYFIEGEFEGFFCEECKG